VKASIQGGGSSAGRLFYLEFPFYVENGDFGGNTPYIDLCRPFGAVFAAFFALFATSSHTFSQQQLLRR
jgi:hypothetical protein